ncbi:MAG TPA: hypothetical protein VHY10_12545, partial [Xanthobacteraceae bacterium]|nr:hypothetical protein [Xanthobacteraceae bacterium]
AAFDLAVLWVVPRVLAVLRHNAPPAPTTARDEMLPLREPFGEREVEGSADVHRKSRHLRVSAASA